VVARRDKFGQLKADVFYVSCIRIRVADEGYIISVMSPTALRFLFSSAPMMGAIWERNIVLVRRDGDVVWKE